MTRRLFCGTLAAVGTVPPVAVAVPAVPKVGRVRVLRLDRSSVNVLALIYGQLAVHSNIRYGAPDAFSISHYRSGLGLVSDRMSLEQAREVAARLGNLPNWGTVDDQGNWASLQAYERMRDLVRAALVAAGVREHA